MVNIDLSTLPDAVREFRPNCPGCTPKEVLDEKARPCSYYDCPGLPEELRVTCDECMYDFAADDGQVKCDHKTCLTARTLKQNVPVYKSWLELIRAESEAV